MQRPARWNLPSQTRLSSTKEALEVLAPPPHFATVEPSVYRSTMPTAANFPFLSRLGLRHVVVLSAGSIARTIATFFDDNAISVSHTGAQSLQSKSRGSSWKPMTDEVIKASLQLILNRDTHPVLVLDSSGFERVGVVVGCLRRLQNWNLNSVINEYRSFAGHKTRYAYEQLIEMFEIDLVVVPATPPTWYSRQLEMDDEDDRAYDQELRSGRLTTQGTLSPGNGESGALPTYKIYYFSADSPLNTDTTPSPVIQCLHVPKSPSAR